MSFTYHQEYLRHYHYLGEGNPDPYIKELARTNMTMAVEMGIKMFQMKWDLPVTGQFYRQLINDLYTLFFSSNICYVFVSYSYMNMDI